MQIWKILSDKLVKVSQNFKKFIKMIYCSLDCSFEFFIKI